MIVRAFHAFYGAGAGLRSQRFSLAACLGFGIPTSTRSTKMESAWYLCPPLYCCGTHDASHYGGHRYQSFNQNSGLSVHALRPRPGRHDSSCISASLVQSVSAIISHLRRKRRWNTIRLTDPTESAFQIWRDQAGLNIHSHWPLVKASYVVLQGIFAPSL